MLWVLGCVLDCCLGLVGCFVSGLLCWLLGGALCFEGFIG